MLTWLHIQGPYVATLLRERGLGSALDYAHFVAFYGVKNPLLVALLQRLEPYPRYIEVEITRRCNLRCIMCEHTYWHEPARDMSFEQFRSIIDQFPKLEWIGLTGIGESFLHKDFLRMLQYVKSKGAFVELYDTFQFIDERTARALVEIGIERILASIDAATKETYEAIRVNSDFDRVVRNAKTLVQLRHEMGSSFPQVDFHYIVLESNMGEVLDYVDLVREVVGDRPTVVQFTRLLHNYPSVEHLFAEIPDDLVRRLEEKVKGTKVNLVWNADVPLAKPPISKCIEWSMPFIFVTGHVIPCCAGNEAGDRDSQKETALGNVFEEDFHSLWYGEKYRKLRSMLRRGEVPAPCGNCCLYEPKRSLGQQGAQGQRGGD